MTPQEFETSLKKGTIPLICYLYGEESFLVDRAVKMLLDRAIDASLRDFNFNVFYGNESKGIDIADAVQTLPMFADRRAVLVKRAEGLSAAACEALLPCIQNPAAGTCLIFSGTKIDQRKKFFTDLKKHGSLVEFKRLYDNKLPGFILSESGAHGKPIDSAAADLLSFLIGNNLQELSSQIEKLAVFTGSQPDHPGGCAGRCQQQQGLYRLRTGQVPLPERPGECAEKPGHPFSQWRGNAHDDRCPVTPFPSALEGQGTA